LTTKPAGVRNTEILFYNGKNLTGIQATLLQVFDGQVQHGIKDLFTDNSFLRHDISLSEPIAKTRSTGKTRHFGKVPPVKSTPEQENTSQNLPQPFRDITILQWLSSKNNLFLYSFMEILSIYFFNRLLKALKEQIHVEMGLTS
jgi:hypothetical protein